MCLSEGILRSAEDIYPGSPHPLGDDTLPQNPTFCLPHAGNNSAPKSLNDQDSFENLFVTQCIGGQESLGATFCKYLHEAGGTSELRTDGRTH